MRAGLLPGLLPGVLPGLVLGGMLLGGLPVAQADAQGIRIHMHGDTGYAADGFLFRPPGQPPFPAIVLIPDERGITPRVIGEATVLAAAGYVAVAVDLNRGLAADAAKHSDEQAEHDIDSALAFLRSQTTVRQDRIGALGWGSGGSYALTLATDNRVRAVAVEEMPLPGDAAVIGKVHAAVLASFGGREAGVSENSVEAFDHAFRAHGNTVNSKIYPDAGRRSSESDDGRFPPKDAEDVARRTERFFASQLKQPP
jgi:carboxymethylenebutenolidase